MTKPEAESMTKTGSSWFMRRFSRILQINGANLRGFASKKRRTTRSRWLFQPSYWGRKARGNPSRLIKKDNAFKRADELKLKSTEMSAFSSE